MHSGYRDYHETQPDGLSRGIRHCPNDSDHPVAAKKLTIRKRLIRDLGASLCSSSVCCVKNMLRVGVSNSTSQAKSHVAQVTACNMMSTSRGIDKSPKADVQRYCFGKRRYRQVQFDLSVERVWEGKHRKGISRQSQE
jgi:hypothetical protein